MLLESILSTKKISDTLTSKELSTSKNLINRNYKHYEVDQDHYPKHLITYDMDLETDYDGITKINIVDWLLNKE